MPSLDLLVARGLTAGPLAGIDLALTAGLMVIGGEQGCGTSTLLRLLAGTQQPDSGTVDGGPCALLEAPPGDEWSEHQIVTVALGAPHLVGREMWAMSAGERQRARLAAVLANPAPVVLLDEPFGVLDTSGVATVLAVLREVAEAGRAVVVVAKAEPRAVALADRVVTLTEHGVR